MAHFAQLDENNVVIAVNVIADSDCLDSEGNESEAVGIAFCKTLWGNYTTWVQTSYNTLLNKKWKLVSNNYGNNLRVEDTEATPFRKNFAQIGYTYDASKDAFIQASPYPSWVLDEETGRYEPPVAYPTDENGDNLPNYAWDEDTTSWKVV